MKGVEMDRSALAEFLRGRRESMQPEDVGIGRGPRRRVVGLRREEAAALCGMSADYYSRLEQRRGPRPSEQLLASIAHGLRLSLDERDHLFRLAGHGEPHRGMRRTHVDVGLARVFDRLSDTPAKIITALGETLKQTALGVALLGDETHFHGPSRSLVYRWFTQPQTRALYPPDAHAMQGRALAARLRPAVARAGAHSSAAALVRRLLSESEEFAAVWGRDDGSPRLSDSIRITHPVVGGLDLHRQALYEQDQQQYLIVYTASPGSVSADRLGRLGDLGPERRTTGSRVG